MDAHNIFVTGGTGRIGRFLLGELKKKGYSITLLCKERSHCKGLTGANFVIGDIMNPASYSEYLKGVDTVIHMAGMTHTNNTLRYYKINTVATGRLIEECEKRDIKRFIFISTRAISENGGDYSRSKLMAEERVKKSAIGWVILRLAEVYGIGGEAGINMILNKAADFPFIPIIGNGKYRVAPVHVSDVIYSITKVIERTDIKNRTYTITGPESLTYDEFIDKVLKLKGAKKFKVHLPVWLSSLLLHIVIMFKGGLFAKDQISRLLSEKSDDISETVKDLDFAPAPISRFYSFI